MLPTFDIRRTPGADTPLNDALYTEASVVGVLPIASADDNVAVDVLVDGSGRIVNYSFAPGQPIPHNPQLLRRIENTLLFTFYKPATTFGQPTYTRVRLNLRKTDMEVKG
jgi:hypothetical protein